MRETARIAFLILVLISSAGCGSLSEPDGPGTFRIGTYNVQNLFDDRDDPDTFDDPAPPPERTNALAEVILAADCDILALQEVENLEVLQRFNSDYLGGLYEEIVLVEGNDPRGIDVAVLSKFPLLDVASYRNREIANPFTGRTIRFSRDLLAIGWRDDRGRTWRLLTTHLKAGGTSYDSVIRKLQVREISRICTEADYISRFGRGLTVLAGDLNAEPWADEIGPLSDLPYSDPARDLPYRFTHASGKVLDYILLSPEADRRYVVGSYTIYREPPSEEASDHYMVYLDLLR